MSLHLGIAMAQLQGVLAATTTTTKKSTSGGSLELIIIVVLFFGAYYFFIRPQRMRVRQQMSVQRQFDVGDEVVTTGGIFGTVRSMEDDRVSLEIAPGTMIEVLRSGIQRRIETTPPDDYAAGDYAPDEDDDHVADGPSEISGNSEPPTGDPADPTAPPPGSAS